MAFMQAELNISGHSPCSNTLPDVLAGEQPNDESVCHRDKHMRCMFTPSSGHGHSCMQEEGAAVSCA
jgi:hypothetical protein